MADPLGVMADLYEWLGEPLTDADRRRMQDWLDADPLVASRRSRYDLSDYGLEEAAVRSPFTDYIDAFGV
ncbi:MAG: sulfotransferase, partial [Acidimicrobiales bacterium]